MEPLLIVAAAAFLGLLGALFHWLTPDPAGVDTLTLIRRLIIGAIAGATLGLPAMYGAFMLDNTTPLGILALVGAALGTMTIGYVGVDIRAMAQKPKQASAAKDPAVDDDTEMMRNG